MKIPSVMQGLIETEDGKVFELDSPKGATWLETISSFRYEPTGDGKPYTVRKEGKNGEYWYGCRKIAGKVRKKYIGKSSEVNVAKLEEIAEALEIPPVPKAHKVAEVAQVVTEVAQDRLTALELQVANLQKAVESLQEVLPGKLEAGDSLELPKVDNEVAEGLRNELGNLEEENELLRQELESTKLQLDNRPPTSGHLYQEIENLKERNRLLHTKSREERQKLQEELAALKYRDESQSRRLAEKQARLDGLEIQNEKLRADYAALLESSTAVTNKLRQEVRELRSELTAANGEIENLENQLTELFEVTPQDAEIQNLKSEVKRLKSELAERSQTPTEKSATASRDLPEAADLLNQLKADRKKSSASLADVEKILELLEEDGNE